MKASKPNRRRNVADVAIFFGHVETARSPDVDSIPNTCHVRKRGLALRIRWSVDRSPYRERLDRCHLTTTPPILLRRCGSTNICL
jgi:hypothetical protein